MAYNGLNQLINYMGKHPVAANLCMWVILFAGLFAFSQLNTQFIPDISMNKIQIVAPWPNSSAAELEQSVILPIEQELKTTPDLKTIESTINPNVARLVLTFKDHINVNQTIENIKARLARITTLPKDMENIEVLQIKIYERIAKIIVSGNDLPTLMIKAKQFEQALLQRGIAKITLQGFPKREINISVPSHILFTHKQSISQLAQTIKHANQQTEVGELGSQENPRTIRSNAQKRLPSDLANLVLPNTDGSLQKLSEFANITTHAAPGSSTLFYKNKPAINMILFRTQGTDALKSATIFKHWLQQESKQLPKKMNLTVYHEHYKVLKSRMDILLKNGAQGFVLVLLLLFLFLNARQAFWIALGIPISFAGALFVLYLFHSSINMISLFAFIMSLGIIVDDAIVVGEQSASLIEQGEDKTQASINGAIHMVRAVSASSLTTLFAFLPLFLVGGIMGAVLMDIPKVIICVIIASVFECFFILPHHLRATMMRATIFSPSPARKKIDAWFTHLRFTTYRKWLTQLLNHPKMTLFIILSLFFLMVCLPLSGRVSFSFFPMPDMDLIYLDAKFVPGTTDDQMIAFLKQSKQALNQAIKPLLKQNPQLIKNILLLKGEGNYPRKPHPLSASIQVELLSADIRTIKNKPIIRAWKKALPQSNYVDNVTISQPRAGPPGQDINIILSGTQSLKKLSLAANALEAQLSTFPGVSELYNDLTPGLDEWIYTLNPHITRYGLTKSNIHTQLRAALSGQEAFRFYDALGQVTVKVRLDKKERDHLATLNRLPIITHDGTMIHADNIITWHHQSGYATIIRTNLKRSIHVFGKVDSSENNANTILAQLKNDFFPKLRHHYGVSISLAGRAQDQAETLLDMQYGLGLAILLIYMTLAWITRSYRLPVLLMAIVPFALLGAILGHWLIGLDITLLSLFGFFGLSGIVLNDAIIMLLAYQRIRQQYKTVQEAITAAACLRSRAVVLTSITTMGGLLPLMFERSMQAQFLIPMAITIVFGLAAATILILILIPTLMVLFHQFFEQHLPTTT
jgi:multidrug efflux pump subunit AcrB